jgi:type IV pilus assembly protein PilB
LKFLLRQDPEVIMVGEIRDSETAGTAVEAGLTGHLVLSSIHAGSTAEASIRMIDLGVDPKMTFTALKGIMAQRLVRKVCPDCAERLGEEEMLAASKQVSSLKERMGLSGCEVEFRERLGHERLVQGRGCSGCRSTGYRGRFLLSSLYLSRSHSWRSPGDRAALDEAIRTMESRCRKDLVAAGFRKLAEGLTTAEELVRSLGSDGKAGPVKSHGVFEEVIPCAS